MTFDLRQLRYAIATADHHSFHRAAEVLKIERSTLSRAILALERCTKVKLFVRSHAGVTMTPLGREFIRDAREIITRVDRLERSMLAVDRGRGGKIMIGHNGPISAGHLRATLFAWGEHSPDIEVDGVEAPRCELISELNSGRIDVAIMMGEANYPGVNRAAFWSERMLLAMPADHPLAIHESLQWVELRNETFLLTERDPGPELRDMLLGRLGTVSSRPTIKMHAVSRESIMSVLGGGLGVTITCEGASGATYPNVVLREIHGPHGQAYLGFSGYWRTDNSNPALRHFLTFVKNRYSLSFDIP
ncbi:LysR family transcriptional regulator [Sinorhizobium garamanticum]|uniref:LysR family transcriptional regulator n=1 Tax=Sinorhizobium garamanticum TaxID=680247 RepID=A0ABY8D684_9HYPH|nr:LysR family transcriptional regulator [Sinorhizobium garamanticum]WEX85807.1 LysR family transcriptional regulator [Sinorhizobium garamanticum]